MITEKEVKQRNKAAAIILRARQIDLRDNPIVVEGTATDIGKVTLGMQFQVTTVNYLAPSLTLVYSGDIVDERYIKAQEENENG